MNNLDGVNYDNERNYGTDNTGWIQVVNYTKTKNLQNTDLLSDE
jgi:hypothetical protein